MSGEKGNKPKSLEDISHLFLSSKKADGGSHRAGRGAGPQNKAGEQGWPGEAFLLLLVEPDASGSFFSSHFQSLLSPLAKEILFVNPFFRGDRIEPKDSKPSSSGPENRSITWEDLSFVASDSNGGTETRDLADGKLVFLPLSLEEEEMLLETAPHAGGLILLVSPSERGVKEAYRVIKTAYKVAKNLTADVLLFGSPSKKAVEAFSAEFPEIVERFLRRKIDFHGSFDPESSSRMDVEFLSKPCLNSLLTSLEGKLKAWHFHRTS